MLHQGNVCNFLALPMEDFQCTKFFVFDLTSLQNAAELLLYPELIQFDPLSLGASKGNENQGRKTTK